MFGFKRSQPDFSPFSDLTEVMEKTPPKKVPDNFTSKIMSGISEERPVKSVWGPLSVMSFRFGFRNVVTKTECSFYFMITGYFYFILGLIMMIGVPLPVASKTNGWLSVQPAFALLLAAALLVIGTLIYKKGDSALGIVRTGMVLFACLILLNGWLGTFFVEHQTFFLGMIFFSLSGLLPVLLLSLAVERYRPYSMSSEVNG